MTEYNNCIKVGDPISPVEQCFSKKEKKKQFHIHAFTQMYKNVHPYSTSWFKGEKIKKPNLHLQSCIICNYKNVMKT